MNVVASFCVFCSLSFIIRCKFLFSERSYILLELPEVFHEHYFLLHPAGEEGEEGGGGEEGGDGAGAGQVGALDQLQEVEGLPGEVAGDTKQVVEEDISL